MPALRVLVVDDSEDDALLDVLALRRQGYEIEYERVDTAEDMRQRLNKAQWDVVLSDFSMPNFSAIEALQIFQEGSFPIPFIVVTGTIGEESAVAMMKAGVNDFVLKTHLKRLPTVVERELRESDTRAAKFRAEAALRESQERYELAITGANDGLWDWNIRDNTIYLSPRWKAMLGYTEDELQNIPSESWLALAHPDEVPLLRAKLVQHMKGESPHFEAEHRMCHKDGNWRWMLTRGIALIDPETQQAYRMAGSLTDITERKRAEEQLLYDALHDGLTGLANRALFTDFLGFSLGHSQRDPNYLCAVLCLNLERFRYINDSFGHGIGDQILKITAERLASVRRGGDVVARFGGDEFAILLDDIDDANDAKLFTEQMLTEVAKPIHVEGHEVYPGARVGIALSSSGYTHPEEMIRDADTAMHRAKSQGRAKYEIFDRAMHGTMLRALKMEQEIRRALDSHEFLPFYQPIVDLCSGKVAAFEALVRWKKATGELVSPAEFIPLAEELGLINQIGQQMLQMACAQISTWQKDFPAEALQISVNLSGKQFNQPDLVDQVDRAVAEAGIDAQFLELEITESILMENTDAIVEMLQRFRERGIRILMDDFGTGYSSLSYLHRFPSNVLKIDGSFVRRMGDDTGSHEIVRTIVLLGHNLGMKVIAEGVETFEQYSMLKSMDCDYAQGYHIAKPMPADQATTFITQRNLGL
ncbi:putative bifunctional diguanylate cyclase/phosphodiesterase [Parachitinimonas caeni]|uniref:EAL domain-containing protein n=1 Tax=Parachitinimonas caeni TaxID=3031301 RepID=A0ABT7E3B8_9NEIS|nr:EAL domain-containing protein [Parachitinimonas caeni]MDK2126793.1 EAL domain-containing protein [Parachitinimonas caeni]